MQVVISLEDVFGAKGEIIDGLDGPEVVFPITELESVRKLMRGTVSELETWGQRERMAKARSAKNGAHRSNGNGRGRKRAGRRPRKDTALANA